MTSTYRTANPLTFACTDCGRRWHAPIECACGAGPLVDLEKPEFREMIVEMEDRRAESHGQTLLWAGVGVGMVGGLFMLLAFPLFIRMIPLPIPFSLPIKVIGMMIGFAVLASKVLAAMFPARRKFPELVANRAAVQLPSKLTAPKRSTLIGVGLVLALGLGITIATPMVEAWIVKEEGEHRREISKRYDRLVECVDEEQRATFGRESESDWTASCKRPLEALYESVDDRSADAALRNTLEEKFRCKEKCDPKQLDKQFGALTEAQQSMGLFGRSPAPRRRDSDFGSPFSPTRPRPTKPTSWNY
jgi:hypothetical protein